MNNIRERGIAYLMSKGKTQLEAEKYVDALIELYPWPPTLYQKLGLDRADIN